MQLTDVIALGDEDKAFLLAWMQHACPEEWAVAVAELEKANGRIAERMAARAVSA